LRNADFCGTLVADQVKNESRQQESQSLSLALSHECSISLCRTTNRVIAHHKAKPCFNNSWPNVQLVHHFVGLECLAVICQFLAVIDTLVSCNFHRKDAAVVVRLRQKSNDGCGVDSGEEWVGCVARCQGEVGDRGVADDGPVDGHGESDVAHGKGDDRWVGNEYGAICIRIERPTIALQMERGDVQAFQTVEAWSQLSAYPTIITTRLTFDRDLLVVIDCSLG
jgi:hypothetical protein